MTERHHYIEISIWPLKTKVGNSIYLFYQHAWENLSEWKRLQKAGSAIPNCTFKILLNQNWLYFLYSLDESIMFWCSLESSHIEMLLMRAMSTNHKCLCWEIRKKGSGYPFYLRLLLKLPLTKILPSPAGLPSFFTSCLLNGLAATIWNKK